MARMRADAAVISMIVLLSTACTSRHQVSTLRPPSASLAASVELTDGREVGVHAEAAASGLQWVVDDPTSPVGPAGTIVDSTRVRGYTLIWRGRGAFRGGLLGGGVGLVTGFVLESLVDRREDACHSDAHKSCLVDFDFDFPGARPIVLGGLGFGLGAALGVLIGTREIYGLDASDDVLVPRVSPRIAPGEAGAELSWSF